MVRVTDEGVPVSPGPVIPSIPSDNVSSPSTIISVKVCIVIVRVRSPPGMNINSTLFNPVKSGSEPVGRISTSDNLYQVDSYTYCETYHYPQQYPEQWRQSQ